MAKKKPGPGRPKLASPMRNQISLRLDDTTTAALDKYRVKIPGPKGKTTTPSDAARDLVIKGLEKEGLL